MQSFLLLLLFVTFSFCLKPRGGFFNNDIKDVDYTYYYDLSNITFPENKLYRLQLVQQPLLEDMFGPTLALFEGYHCGLAIYAEEPDGVFPDELLLQYNVRDDEPFSITDFIAPRIITDSDGHQSLMWVQYVQAYAVDHVELTDPSDKWTIFNDVARNVPGKYLTWLFNDYATQYSIDNDVYSIYSIWSSWRALPSYVTDAHCHSFVWRGLRALRDNFGVELTQDPIGRDYVSVYSDPAPRCADPNSEEDLAQMVEFYEYFQFWEPTCWEDVVEFLLEIVLLYVEDEMVIYSQGDYWFAYLTHPYLGVHYPADVLPGYD